MKKWILVFLLINHYALIAQIENDTADIAIGITNYFFAYTPNIIKGSNAIGPCFHLNASGKFSVKISALIDLKKYEYYKYTHFKTDTFTELNFFLPLLFNYNFYLNKQINWFLTSGVVIGGNYFVDKNNNTQKTKGFNLIVGSGFSYIPVKNLQIQFYPTIRYSEKNLFPGFFIDLSIPFNSNKCL